jgi:phage/conjugal plasmid C-4 type zinc finger TraR family protein
VSDEASFDLAEVLADRERENAIKKAKAALKRAGSRVCEDCKGEIAEIRRRALPSATRCISCQIAHEEGAKGR